MKKWFACLAVAGLLFSAGVGVSHAESWYPLNTDADGRTGYIDNDTVEKDDAQAKLNLKIVDLAVITLFILCNLIVLQRLRNCSR